MPELAGFGLSDMTRLGAELRRSGANASSMEEAADAIVRALRAGLLVAGGGGPACALVRLFVTLPYERLQPSLQEAAKRALGGREPEPAMKCLTLLASAGELEAWNSRHRSVAHQALPLASEESVARSPMIAQLIRQLGVEVGALISADPSLMTDVGQHTFNVFHVAEAKGSPYIPAQEEFVIPFGVRSVLGFGGLLPPGELFATILFSREPISREVAELFRTLALNVKVALLPFTGDRVLA